MSGEDLLLLGTFSKNGVGQVSESTIDGLNHLLNQPTATKQNSMSKLVPSNETSQMQASATQVNDDDSTEIAKRIV